MVCGACGLPGHNQRTCSLKSLSIGSSSKSYSSSRSSDVSSFFHEPPRETRKCGNCRMPGHNAQTCPSINSGGANWTRKLPENHSSGETRRCGECGKVGHNRQTCPSLKQWKSAGPDDFSFLSEPKSTRKCGTCQKSGHDSRTCPERNTSPSWVSHRDHSLIPAVADSREACGKGEKLCGYCREPGHTRNSDKCPLRDFWENHWFNEGAALAFSKGPSEHDGNGHIYMYRKDSKAKGDEDWCKIGRSKDLPERRIRAQELNNDESYKLVWSEETPNHMMVERVIHEQLKPFHKPKKSGDGRTEWFKGDPECFKRVGLDVIKEVKMEYGEDKDKRSHRSWEVEDLMARLSDQLTITKWQRNK